MNNQNKISEEKSQLELEKLKEEIRSIKKPMWKDPKIAGTVLAFIVSLLFNVLQYSNTTKIEDRLEKEFAIKEDQWKVDKKRLDLVISRLSQDINEGEERKVRIKKIEEELKQVERDIFIWDEAIFKDESELVFMKNELRKHEGAGEKNMANAVRKNIALQKTKIGTKKEELKKAEKRRLDLEKQMD